MTTVLLRGNSVGAQGAVNALLKLTVGNTASEVAMTESLISDDGTTVAVSGILLANIQKIPTGTPVNAVAATNTVTSDNTNNGDGETVTVNGKVYTFKTALTPAEGEILIAGTADGSLTNLSRAINNSGGTPGTDYQIAAAHPTVSAGAVSAHAIVLSAKIKGAGGNALTLAESAAHLSITGATFAGGVNGTVGTQWEVRVDSSYLYACVAAQTIADANWRRISLGTAY